MNAVNGSTGGIAGFGRGLSETIQVVSQFSKFAAVGSVRFRSRSAPSWLQRATLAVGASNDEGAPARVTVGARCPGCRADRRVRCGITGCRRLPNVPHPGVVTYISYYRGPRRARAHPHSLGAANCAVNVSANGRSGHVRTESCSRGFRPETARPGGIREALIWSWSV
jgi:hypothetical protein